MYREFKNMNEAVNAFVAWCERRNIPEGLSDEDFLNAVYKAGYATDPDYLEKVKRYF